MDLGLTGRSAILLASTRGLGFACAEAIAREGVRVVVNGRTAADVDAAVARIDGAIGVVGDSTTAEVQEALLAVCPEPDIVLLNGEGPAPAAFEHITEATLTDALQRSLVGPLLFVQRVLPGMKARGFGRIVAISSAMVKSPSPYMILSHAPRLGLTGALKALSKECASSNVTINQLLPERFDTARQEQMAQLAMALKGIGHDEARTEQIATIRAGRLGRADELGDTFAFLCSANGGYLSGQNLQLDGASYEGVF